MHECVTTSTTPVEVRITEYAIASLLCKKKSCRHSCSYLLLNLHCYSHSTVVQIFRRAVATSTSKYRKLSLWLAPPECLHSTSINHTDPEQIYMLLISVTYKCLSFDERQGGIDPLGHTFADISYHVVTVCMCG